MNKTLFEDILNDIIRRHQGDKNTLVVICHSNGERTITSYQYLVVEDDYLMLTRTNDENMCQYILYGAITAIYSDNV